MKRFFVVGLVVLSSILIVSCSNPNTASVTINLGTSSAFNVHHESWIDKVVRVITFSKKAYAQSAPSELTKLWVEISAPDFDTYIVDADMANDVVEIFDVPAGKERNFAVVGSYSFREVTTERYYGGQATVDLNAGETKDVPITMGNLPRPNGTTGSVTLEWITPNYVWSYPNPASFFDEIITGDGMRVYKKKPGESSFHYVMDVPVDSAPHYDTDFEVAVEGMYTFKYVPYNQFGVGSYIEFTYDYTGM